MAIPGLTDIWPISTDNNQTKKVLYPDGITALAEDYAETEQIREYEDLVRFNSIIKSPGIVSLKASELNTTAPYTGRKLYPYTINNSLIIRNGVGFTRNGGMVVISNDINIPVADWATKITNYTTDTITNKVYLVIRKITYDVLNRSHPITGIQQDTRRYIVDGRDCVEFLSVPLSYTGNPYLYDKDVVILGRITSISSPVINFDYTRLTGYRQLLQVTEAPTCDVGGFDMDGHINMRSLWQILNLPLIGSSYWLKNGSVNSSDFAKLYTLNNYRLGLLRDIKFGSTGGNNYGLILTNPNTLPKMKVFPALAPPNSIELKVSGVTEYSKTIPAGHVCYINLSDVASGFNEAIGNTSGIEIVPIENDNPVGTIGYTLETASYSTITTYNNADRLRIYPICWHYLSTDGTERKLIFADGTILNLNEELSSKGKYSGYVDTDGDNMYGDLTIVKTPGALIFKKDNLSYTSRTKAGLIWKDATIGSAEKTLANFYRIDNVDPESTDFTNGDMILLTFDNSGSNQQMFIFRQDGRMQVFGIPEEDDDVVRLIDLRSKVNKTGDNMIGDLIFLNGSQPVVKTTSPGMTLIDTTDTDSYQTFSIKNNNEQLIGRIIRFSSNATVGYTDYEEGDMLFESWKNDNTSKVSFSIKQISGSINNVGKFFNLLVDNDLIVTRDVEVVGDIHAVGDVRTNDVGIIYESNVNKSLKLILNNMKSRSWFFSN